MKTLLKIVGGLVVLLLVVAACGYGYLMFAYPKVPPPPACQVRCDAGTAGARQVPDRSRRRLHHLPYAARLDEVLRPGQARDCSAPAASEFDLGPAGIAVFEEHHARGHRLVDRRRAAARRDAGRVEGRHAAVPADAVSAFRRDVRRRRARGAGLHSLAEGDREHRAGAAA